MSNHQLVCCASKGQPQFCATLISPMGRQPGVLYISVVTSVWKMELNDQLLTAHRAELGLPAEPPHKVSKTKPYPTIPSETVLNYEFVMDHLKDSIRSGKLSMKDEVSIPPQIAVNYTINGVPFKGVFAQFTNSNPLEFALITAKALNDAYSVMYDMRECAAAQGIDLGPVDGKNQAISDPQVMEKLQQAQLRRANLSLVNPSARSKKITKGFGSAATQ